jgi:diguanylate cyclase (GGDEF)-like protein
MLHLNIGTTLLGLKQPAEALVHFNDARAILEKDGSELDVLSALANTGGALRRLARYGEALRIDREILARATKGGIKVRVADAMTDIGEVLDLMGRSDEAVKQVGAAIDYCTKEGLKRNLEDAEEVMVRVLEKRGDYRGALEHQKHQAEVRKERITEENTAAMAELNVKYESEKKERQIREQQLTIEHATYMRNLVIAGAIITLALLGWTWSRYRAKKREASLHEFLSRTDPLTGLANRRALLAMLEREVLRARRDRQPLSLLIADVDHFKKFNDTWGHDTGDEVLVRAAGALKGVLREIDLLARWGGEEFLAMLPGVSGESARLVGERMRDALKSVTLERGGEVVRITATFGVSPLSPDETVDDCLKRADEALYRGKEEGRDRVIVIEPPAVRLEAVG